MSSHLGNLHGSGGRMGGTIDADRIFQRHTVSDIRQMYGKYVEDMKEKDEKLRHVVGDSYRDLISSADAIKDIAEQCQVVCEKLSTLVDASEEVVEMPGSSATKDEEVEKVYWVASKVKYMVDSQEAIYGHLDRDEYYLAAVRYLRAVEMHKEFDVSCEKYARQFPFLEHLWPSVRRLDGEVWNRGQEWLTQQEHVDVEDGASVLACLALLRPLDSNDVLRYLVTSRRKYIVAKGKHGDDLSELVAVTLEAIWSTVCLIMEVFGDSGHKPMIRLLETLVDGEQEAVHTLSSRARDAIAKLEGFTKGALQLETEDWLRKTAHEVQQTLRPLFSSTVSCRELKDIEEFVQDRLSKWMCCVHQGDDVLDMSCTALSQYAMGDIVSLWDQTCQDLVVTHAKKIISTRFHGVGEIVEKLVAEARSQSKNEAVSVDPIGQYDESTVYKDLNAIVSSGAVQREWWIQVACEYFEELNQALGTALSESIDCLSIGNKKYASGSDEFVSFEDYISQEFAAAMESMVSRMEQARVNATKDTVIGISLVFVQLTSKILYSCDSFTKLLHFQEVARDGGTYDGSVLHPWARETLKKIQDLRISSNQTWAKWFNGEIARQVGQSSAFDVLPSSSSTGEDESSSTGVPSFPSSWLMGALTCFCEELEKAGGSDLQEDLVKQAMHFFKSTMLSTALDMEDYAPSTSRDDVLQRIYDIRFICSLFDDDGGDRATAKDILDRLSARIDPIDWSGCSKAIEENVGIFSANAASFLRISNTHDVGSVNRENEGNGIMALSTSTSRFAYLPAKLPSRANKMQSAYGLSNSFDDDGTSLGNLPSSVSAQSAITSLLGTKAAEMSAKIEGYASGGLLGSFFTD